MLNDTSGHSVRVHTATLNMLGITDKTPDLSENLSCFLRDENGRLTSWIREFAPMPYIVAMMTKAPDDIQEHLGYFLDFPESHGVTTIM
ncbi:MAG: hypothetical protein CSA74_02100 [Rhodobacterales bacterium]|nr:MAG: hypothetical protein CSA74_02100 [Rhodobacterales bacterium]